MIALATIRVGAALCGPLALALVLPLGCGGGGGGGGSAWGFGATDTATESDTGGAGGPLVVGGATGSGVDAGGGDDAPAACSTGDDCPASRPACLPPGLCFACSDDAGCAVWERCEAGRCLPRVCSPGALSCDADTQLTCGPDGRELTAFPCLPGQCNAAEACTGCEPGARVCADGSVFVCNAAGDGVQHGQTCPTGTECLGGQCIDCLFPGEHACVAGRAAVCGPYGFYEIVNDCEAKGLSCLRGECSACEPETTACTGSKLRCRIDGTFETIEDCSEFGLLCWEAQCFPKCSDYDFKQGVEGTCSDGVCCLLPTSERAITGLNECAPAGGVAIPWHLCQTPTCCQRPDGTIADTTIGLCAGANGILIPADLCAATVCCKRGPWTYAEESMGACGADGGVGVDAQWCEPSECCALQDGSLELHPGGCPATATATAGLLCEGVRADQIILPGVSIDADGGCTDTPYLAVPSSLADAVVVFDLDSLDVAYGPFSVCSDPSRILLTPDNDVVISCRGDGNVWMTAIDGTVLWKRQLDACSISRGVALTPDLRLFASCWDPGRVWELDLSNGSTIGAEVSVPGGVYGLAADSTGVYAVGWDGVTKIGTDLPGGLAEVWHEQAYGYGIATDGLGTVWVGGSGLKALSGDTGELLSLLHPDRFIHGVAVGPDGRVYGAVAGENRILRVDPNTSSDWLTLPTLSEHPKGVAAAADGNIYSVNLLSSDVVRFTPEGDKTRFGTGELSWPYAYSGDMTGFTASCLADTGTTWVSELIQPTGEPVVWLSVEWKAQVPADGSVSLSYRIDEQGTWGPVPAAGEPLVLSGTSIRVRALLSAAPGTSSTLESVTVTWLAF